MTSRSAVLVKMGEWTNRTIVLPVVVFFPTSRCNSRCVSCDWWKCSGAGDLTLAEIVQRLLQDRGVHTTDSSLDRFFKRHKVSFKKNSARIRAGQARRQSRA